MKQKRSWKNLKGKFGERQKALSGEKCVCGCGKFISNRAAKAKFKGLTVGYVKGHTWKNKNIPESAKQKMSRNHADVSGDKNPNYGKGLFGKDNPNWQGGKKKKYYRKGNQIGVARKVDRIFRKTIKNRDKECILCRNKTRLTVHHIESWCENESIRFNPNNAITLCKSCHARVDNKARQEQYKLMLKAYIKFYE